MVRLTIGRKIALAVVAVAIVSIVTMAWVTSSNIRRGFLNYLNQLQSQDLEQLSVLMAERYREEGSFNWLHERRDALRPLLDRMHLRLNAEPEGDRRPPPPPEDDRRGPPPERPPPPGARDPMGFASRISVLDAEGTVVAGPPDYVEGVTRPIVVDGVQVGLLRLRPLRVPGAEDGSAFLREQVRDILWLSALLIVAATLVAMWLARHLLRPVASLREVTARLARGELVARAPLLSRDELAELALHVNAMAEALEANEQQRRRMIADIAHELRTPITVIRGEIEALIDGIRQADPRALDSLHAEVLRLNQLVDDLHQLTLADTGALSFAWQTVDLEGVMLPVLERYRARAAGAGLELTWTLPGRELAVRADANRLTQVFVNLLENSVRYTDAGGQIVVSLATSDGRAVLRIDDSAPGVPAEAHARIFERLYRVDSARTRERGGSGLGLAICKALVDAHGGAIEAQASPLGGVRVVVTLPLAS